MRILVVEDEQIVAERVMRLARETLQDQLKSIRHIEYFSDALVYLQTHPVDLLLLDLNLNGADGFRILSEAIAGSFHTIIVSAHTDQAIRAFEYGVVDFVPKPFTKERFGKALDRFRQMSCLREMKFLGVKNEGRVEMISLSEILYIQGADDYSEIHCLNGSQYLHNKTLQNLQQILPERFQRLHRSYLVNMDFVKGRQDLGGGRYEVVMQNGERLRLSRRKIRFFLT